MFDLGQLNNYIFPLVIIVIAIAMLVKIWEWVLNRDNNDQTLESRKKQRHRVYVDHDPYDNQKEDDYPTTGKKSFDASAYRAKDSLLTQAEISFYHVLKQAVGDSAIISPKVNLWDIFYIKQSDRANFMALKSKIDRKHVDFLLCHTQTLKPIIGIELDDSSHQRKDRIERDIWVDSVFEAANLPILHIPAKRAYHVDSIAEMIRQYLLDAQGINTQDDYYTSSNLICPKCEDEMVLRQVKTGKHAGTKFWGCSNYPNCKHVVAYKD